MENIRETVSKNIINLRKQNKMTQLDLAKKINYSDKAISRWENGEVVPDVETIAKLAEIFNVSVSSILENQDNAEIKKINKPTAKEILSQVFIVCEVWTIIAVVFAYFIVSKDIVLWQLLLWGIPATAFFLMLLNSKRQDNITAFVCGTIFIWSAIVCVFLHMLNSLPWYIFIVGIPMQGLLIIRYLFNYKQKVVIKIPKRKTKTEK